MKKMLIDLWNGKIRPIENFSDDEAYISMQDKLLKEENKLLKNFSQEEKRLYRKFEEVQSEFECVESELIFVKGFRMGVRFILESLCED